MTDINLNNIKRYKDLGNGIFLFDGAIDGGVEFREQIEKLAENIWEENNSINDDFGSTRKDATIEPEVKAGNPYWKYYYETLSHCLNTYSLVTKGKESPYVLHDAPEGYKDVVHVSKYRVGGYVNTHTDNDIREDDGTVTMIWYINDNYEGGEVGFIDPDITVKPEEGDVLIFPAITPHYSKELLRGTKYLSIKQSDT